MGVDLKALVCRLADNEVEFVLVGGFAAAIHGCSLVTQDVDVVIVMERENMGRLYTAVADLDPVFRNTSPPRPFVEEDVNSDGWKNLYLSTRLGPLDCLGEVKGIGDYHSCLGESSTVVLDNQRIRVLSASQLIKAKEAMGRPRDLQAVQELKAMAGLRQDEHEN